MATKAKHDGGDGAKDVEDFADLRQPWVGFVADLGARLQGVVGRGANDDRGVKDCE